MDIKIFDVENVCSAKMIAGFGQANTTSYAAVQVSDSEVTEDALREGIRKRVMEHQKDTHMGLARMAMLVAYTSDLQVLANKVLKEQGFQHTRWMSKGKHPETKLRMWWFPLNHQDLPSTSTSKDK